MNALLLVDIQNDLLPGGARAVPGGEAILPVVRRVAPRFDRRVAIQDWHPPGHGCFASSHPGHRPGDVVEIEGLTQALLPDHCVQGTAGAELAPGLCGLGLTAVFRTGIDPRFDSESAFFDRGRRQATGLNDWLRAVGVRDLFVCGLAVEERVLATALDAVRLGFPTTAIRDACAGFGRVAGDVDRAFGEMERAGVCVVRSDELSFAREEPLPA